MSSPLEQAATRLEDQVTQEERIHRSFQPDINRFNRAFGQGLQGDVRTRVWQLRALPWQTLLDYTDTERANAITPVIDGRVLPDIIGRCSVNGVRVLCR